MNLTITLYEDDEDEVVLPAKYEVCPRCRGTKTHVNPNIDSHGITSEEMDELGDDFRDDYLSGVYDVACQECQGDGLVLVVDEPRCTAAQLAAWADHERERYETDAIYAMERAMGA